MMHLVPKVPTSPSLPKLCTSENNATSMNQCSGKLLIFNMDTYLKECLKRWDHMVYQCINANCSGVLIISALSAQELRSSATLLKLLEFNFGTLPLVEVISSKFETSEVASFFSSSPSSPLIATIAWIVTRNGMTFLLQQQCLSS